MLRMLWQAHLLWRRKVNKKAFFALSLKRFHSWKKLSVCDKGKHSYYDFVFLLLNTTSVFSLSDLFTPASDLCVKNDHSLLRQKCHFKFESLQFQQQATDFCLSSAVKKKKKDFYILGNTHYFFLESLERLIPLFEHKTIALLQPASQQAISLA